MKLKYKKDAYFHKAHKILSVEETQTTEYETKLTE